MIRTLPFPDADHNEMNADWLEARLLLGLGGKYASWTSVANTIAREVGRDAEEADIQASGIRAVMQERERVLKRLYPLRLTDTGAEAAPWADKCDAYTFMLFVSLTHLYDELALAKGAANKPAELFECLTEQSLKSMIGRVVRFGAPRRKPMPSDFMRALHYLVKDLGEKLGLNDIVPQSAGDDDLDVIAWIPFGDGRPSQPILVVQCGIGKKWEDKRNDLNLVHWSRRIDFHNAPLRMFAVPIQVPGGAVWRETAGMGGVILDRLRIVKLLKKGSLAGAVGKAVRDWSKASAPKIEALAS